MTIMVDDDYYGNDKRPSEPQDAKNSGIKFNENEIIKNITDLIKSELDTLKEDEYMKVTIDDNIIIHINKKTVYDLSVTRRRI